jgi:methyltransferase-like protein 23
LADIELSIALPPYDEGTLEGLVQRFGLKEEHWPYYLENWPATFALAEDLKQRALIKPEHAVLDLGCGSGVLSCFLWLAYGLQATALDFNPEACALTRWNLVRHGCPRPKVLCGDLTRMPVRTRFDWILGGEILYAPNLLPQVLGCLHSHLSPQGEAWFGDSRRSSAEPFADLARSQGFAVEILSPRGEKAIAYRLKRI